MNRVVEIDLGDRKSHYGVLSEEGVVIEEGSVQTTPAAFKAHFEALESSLIALEVGVHSRWVSRVLSDCSHPVIVANPVRLKLIHKSSRKSDRVDACALPRLVRVDPQLLSPVQHRSEEDQCMLSVLRVRDVLVGTRTKLINCARGIVKPPTGTRIPNCSADCFASHAGQAIPADLRVALDPLIEQIQSLTNLIKRYDRQIAGIAAKKYPATRVLQQIQGVGPLTALGFVLTIGQSERLVCSRDAGAYFGLRPRCYQSGESNPQLGISKEGDGFMRRLLVQAARYILVPFGPDFFIHIATIVCGLLIAVGLEQTVEYFHHRHQVAEIRESLRVERGMNINRFAVQTDQFLRFAPILQGNLDTLLYIRQHPKSTPDQWPHKLRWSAVIILYSDSAWKTAQESGVLQYMPRAEVDDYSRLYSRLARLTERGLAESQALYQAMNFVFRDPDPAHLPPAELDREIELMTQFLNEHLQSAHEQRGLARLFPDFKPVPTRDQLRA